MKGDLETCCLKQESPELSKCFTSEGPSPASCSDEEARPEPEPRITVAGAQGSELKKYDLWPGRPETMGSGAVAACLQFRKDPEGTSPYLPSQGSPPLSVFLLSLPRLSVQISTQCPCSGLEWPPVSPALISFPSTPHLRKKIFFLVQQSQISFILKDYGECCNDLCNKQTHPGLSKAGLRTAEFMST